MLKDKDVETLMNNPVKPHEKILNILKQMSTNQTSYSSDTEKLEKANVAHSLLGALRNFCIASKSHLDSEETKVFKSFF